MNIKNAILTMVSGMLLPPSHAHAQAYNYNLRFSLSEKNFVDSIPLTMENGKLLVKARSGGHDYRMYIDTGSSQGVLYANGDMEYVCERGTITSHDANGNSGKVTVVEFPEFTIGHLTVSGYCGTLTNRPSHTDDHDAILGFDLINKGLVAKIDVEAGLLILTDRRRHFDSERGYTMKYRLLRWVPNVKLSPYPGCTDEARFDTGSQRLYEMSNSSCEEFSTQDVGFSSQIEGTSTGMRTIASMGVEHPDKMSFLHLDHLEMGGFAFADYHTLTTQGKSRIGSQLLQYGSVTINPHRRHIVFIPYGGDDSLRIGNSQTDIAFVPSEGRPMVGLVWEGSRHYSCGFRQGDVILSVDGTGIGSFAQFVSYPFVKGRTYQFGVRGADGSLRTVVSER